MQPSASLGRPPRPIPVPQPEDAMQSSRPQKPKVPVLEKHLLDQLSSEEQNSLNSKFQEASDAEKKVSVVFFTVIFGLFFCVFFGHTEAKELHELIFHSLCFFCFFSLSLFFNKCGLVEGGRTILFLKVAVAVVYFNPQI